MRTIDAVSEYIIYKLQYMYIYILICYYLRVVAQPRTYTRFAGKQGRRFISRLRNIQTRQVHAYLIYYVNVIRLSRTPQTRGGERIIAIYLYAVDEILHNVIAYIPITDRMLYHAYLRSRRRCVIWVTTISIPGIKASRGV